MLLHVEELKAELKRRLRYHKAQFGVTLDVMADDVAMAAEWHEGRLVLRVAFSGGPTWLIPFDRKAEEAVRRGMMRNERD